MKNKHKITIFAALFATLTVILGAFSFIGALFHSEKVK